MKLVRYSGNPIISPSKSHEWESLTTCNPGVIYDKGRFYMLYRAAGNDVKHVIRFGLATSLDGFHFERCSERPVFAPSKDGPDSGSVEDPRIVKFGSEYYITYAYRPYAPGQYWTFEHDEVLKPKSDEYTPTVIRENMGNSGLAMTTDFQSFQRLGRLTSPVLDDRDVIFFPEKINGKYAMLHRPKQYVGKKYGVKYASIWIKFSEDLFHWEDKKSHLLLSGRENTWEEKIGGSTPPMKTSHGWLMLYHGVEKGGLGHYRVGAMLLDLNDPLHILAKTNECILEPEEDYEMNGFYPGCIFPTGSVIKDNTLYVYYGGADRYVCVATCKVDELLDYLMTSCKM
jgi:predicted GH43/DUF377 family glycosyl hydrolase